MAKVKNTILLFFLFVIVIFSGCVSQSEKMTPQTMPNSSEMPIVNNVIEEKCEPIWRCSEWGECSKNGFQTRTCNDTNNCNESKPLIMQSCNYISKIGDFIEQNSIKITLMSARVENHIGEFNIYTGYDYLPDEGYKFLIVKVSAKNDAQKSKYISFGMITDSNKNQYEDNIASSSLEDKFEIKELLPNVKEEGEIAFEVPINETSFRFIYPFNSYAGEYGEWEINIGDKISSLHCGKEKELPCSGKCYYLFEVVNGTCTRECGYIQVRIDGNCIDCGGLNQPCCEGVECFGMRKCDNNKCRDCTFEEIIQKLC